MLNHDLSSMKVSAAASRIGSLLVIFLFQVFGTVLVAGPLPYSMRSWEAHATRNPETCWKCSYPFFSGTYEALMINQALLFAVTGVNPAKPHGPVSLETASRSFIKEFEEFLKDEPEAMPWFTTTTGAVVLNRSGLVTVSLATGSYTGGAHGMESIGYYVFDAATGRRLTLEDIMVQGYQSRLDALIERRFRQDKGLKPGEPLNGDNGGLFDNVIRHNDNFAITDSGITFLYNPYEIAPYVFGQIAIELKWAEIRTLVKRQYILM